MKLISESINIYKPTIFSIFSIFIRISGYLLFLGFLYHKFFINFLFTFNLFLIFFYLLYFFIILFLLHIFFGFYKNISNLPNLKFQKFKYYIILQIINFNIFYFIMIICNKLYILNIKNILIIYFNHISLFL